MKEGIELHIHVYIMSQYDENSNTDLEQEMLTFEEWVVGGNLVERCSSGSEPDPEPNREFVPVANTTPESLQTI
jgi:hypothetical protein